MSLSYTQFWFNKWRNPDTPIKLYIVSSKTGNSLCSFLSPSPENQSITMLWALEICAKIHKCLVLWWLFPFFLDVEWNIPVTGVRPNWNGAHYSATVPILDGKGSPIKPNFSSRVIQELETPFWWRAEGMDSLLQAEQLCSAGASWSGWLWLGRRRQPHHSFHHEEAERSWWCEAGGKCKQVRQLR